MHVATHIHTHTQAHTHAHKHTQTHTQRNMAKGILNKNNTVGVINLLDFKLYSRDPQY